MFSLSSAQTDVHHLVAVDAERLHRLPISFANADLHARARCCMVYFIISATRMLVLNSGASIRL